MQLTTDWHIHSNNSCDEASLPITELLTTAGTLGIEDFGVTDHIHTPYNLPDLEASRRDFLACNPPSRFHFGVEVSCVSQWELDEIAGGGYAAPVYGLRSDGPADGALAIGLTAEDIARLGIEYVVGGAHWPMYCPITREDVIRDYHRQNMFLATHPLVDIVAHPWWWMGHWQTADGSYPAEPWFDDFAVIYAAMHDEFAAAAREHGKAVEINLGAQLLHPGYPESYKRQYLDYLANLHAHGVTLSIGSDTHSRTYTPDLHSAADMLASVGLDAITFWRLPAR